MRLIDLSSPVDASSIEPDPLVHDVLSPREGAKHMCEEMRTHFGIDFDPDDLPDGEFLSLDRMTLTTHTGTHVDAPSHYGSRSSYRAGGPRHIDEVPLEWFYRPALLLDVSGRPAGTVGVDDLGREFDRLGRTPEPLDIVLLRTGASAWSGTTRYFTDFVGLDGPAVRLLLGLGVKVIGTDAFSLDAPFGTIIERYKRTGDRSVLWPAHVAGRDHEFCQIERLTNLEALPSANFMLACFPVKIRSAGAGWARAVAILDD